MEKFLDLTGLTYLWGKIKDAIEGKANINHTHSEYLTEDDVSNTYAKKTDIANVYIYKGSLASFSALPASGLNAGDVYNVEDTGKNYAWTGTEWDDLGGSFDVDIQSITTAEIDSICV